MRISAIVLLAMAPLTASAGPVEAFWTNLQALCGQAFEGELVKSPEGEDGFAGKRLVMHVRECGEDRVRVPFVVGEDYSRTWVLTRKGDRVEFKHDHRHEDGSHDEVTMYGGTTTNRGRGEAQYFPADEETRERIEEAFSNVWVVRIRPGDTFTYGLWRLGTPRVFRIDFDLSAPVDAPPAPWGWED